LPVIINIENHHINHRFTPSVHLTKTTINKPVKEWEIDEEGDASPLKEVESLRNAECPNKAVSAIFGTEKQADKGISKRVFFYFWEDKDIYCINLLG